MKLTQRITCLALAALAATGAITAPSTAASASPRGIEAEVVIDFWDEATAGLSVSGTYKPIVGDFGGPAAGQDDILWYAPGPATDYLWISDGDGTFSSFALPPQVNGTYTPLVGDFAGNGLDDIVWYAPGTAADYLWTTNGLGFNTQAVSVGGTYAPVVLDDAAGKDDILWAKAGGGPGWIWSFEGMGTYLSHPITSPTGSVPLVGRFDAGVCADVFWYGAGFAQDALWHLDCSGNIGASFPATVNGTYQPTVNDYTPSGDGISDILWYRSNGSTTLWQSDGGDGKFTATSHNIPTAGTPLPVAKNWGLVHLWTQNGADRVFWKTGSGDYNAPLSTTKLGTGYQPIIGNFVGQNADIFWYKPGSSAERLFFTA